MMWFLWLVLRSLRFPLGRLLYRWAQRLMPKTERVEVAPDLDLVTTTAMMKQLAKRYDACAFIGIRRCNEEPDDVYMLSNNVINRAEFLQTVTDCYREGGRPIKEDDI